VDPLRTDTRAKRSGQPETISTPAAIVIDRASVEIRIGSRWDDFAGMWKQWSALATLPGQDGTARPEFCVPCWAESPQGSGYVAQAWLGDDLVAVAPMWSRRVGPVRTLRPIGSGRSTRASLLVKPGYEPALTLLIEDLLESHCVEFDQPIERDLIPNDPATRRSAFTATQTSSFRADDMLRVNVADEASVRAVDDADDPALASLTHGQWIAEKDSQWSLARVQTAVDVVVRSGAGFVIADATQGAALWIVGGGEMTLLCATGTCQPMGASWTASLVRAARVAEERNVSRGHLPVPLLEAGHKCGLPVFTRPRRTVLVAKSAAKLAALRMVSKQPPLRPELLAS
jgi:hypothetical protein